MCARVCSCNNKGYCEDGVCHCYAGYKGVGCELVACVDDCK